MSKLKLNKKALALFLTGTLAVGVGATIFKNAKDGQDSRPVIENHIGHLDINPLINFNLDEEDFVVLNMGDHDTVKTHFDMQKARYCNEHDITLGIIISPDSQDEAEIYDDVEYMKNLIREYDIDFPVYLDINEIITNDNLNNEIKTKLIKNFTEKCSANNIYVGLYGTDTNLTRVKKYCGITEYDAFLVMDDEQIKYDGSYSIVKDLEEKIIASTDLSVPIDKKGLNDKNRLYKDGTYKISPGEDITDVALKYGMSVKELLSFNGLTREDITKGTYIRIPSIVDNVISTDLEVNYPELTTPLRGCDISYAQGNNIDWDLMQKNFEFVILRCAQGLSADTTFEGNALNASQNDIPIGVYCYNDYTLKNSDSIETFIKNQQAQADFTINLLKNKKIDYPVYLDIEGNISKELNQEAVEKMLDIWVNTMASAGYEPGLYCNQADFKYLQSQVDYDLTERLHVWVAGGDQYTGETTSIPLEEIVPSTSVKENIPGAKIVQATDSTIGGGAGNGKGHLDVNFSYYDYANGEIIGENNQDDQIKNFARYDYSLMGFGAATVIGTVAIGAGIIGIKKRKNKNKTKSKTTKGRV